MSSSLNILCIDSSTEACSVALLTNNQAIYQRFMLAPREHTQKILPTIDEIVKEAQLTLSEIDVIAYGQGPGSFTGVRIGISIAQGLAFGLDKKMVGISTLQAMSQQAYVEHKLKNQPCEHVYAAIDARMGEVYFAHYQLNNGVMELQGEEKVITPEALIEIQQNNNISVLADSLLVGTGWAAYPVLLDYYKSCVSTDVLYPNASFMFDSAMCKIQQNRDVDPEMAIPVYLRDTVTWKKLPGRE
jgi:tRNA threonylcarbamoyladenosine biosynthesis protein TsaB